MAVGCTRCDAAARGAGPRRHSLAAEQHRRRFRAIVGGRIRAAFAPLLDALPRLASSAATVRGDASTRRDSSPLDEAARIAGAAASALEGAGFAKELRAEIDSAARNASAATKTSLRKQLDKHEDRRINGIRLADSPRLRPIIEGFAAENAALITGIAPQLASEVQALVVRGLTDGTPHERLAKLIREKLDISARRAEQIAVDQVGKLDGQLSAQRAQDIGVTHFWWRSSNDERVRGNPDGLYPKATPSHFARNGQRFAYADPPLGKNGEPELPGTAINCRCFGEPDLDSIESVSAAGAAAEEQVTATPPGRSVEEEEAEAERLMAEVEAMLAQQAADLEERMRIAEPEPVAPPSAAETPLDDLAQEAQAQTLAMQLDFADPVAVEAAIKRHRARRRAAERAATAR